MKTRKHLYGAHMNVYRVYVHLSSHDGDMFVQEYVWQGCNHIDFVKDFCDLFSTNPEGGLCWHDWDAEVEETDVIKFEAGIVSIGRVEPM